MGASVRTSLSKSDRDARRQGRGAQGTYGVGHGSKGRAAVG